MRKYSKLISDQGAAGTAADFLVGARARTLTRHALARVTFEMDMTLKILGWAGTGVDSKIKNVVFLTMVTRVAHQFHQKNISSKILLVNQNKWVSRKGNFSKQCFLRS